MVQFVCIFQSSSFSVASGPVLRPRGLFGVVGGIMETSAEGGTPQPITHSLSFDYSRLDKATNNGILRTTFQPLEIKRKISIRLASLAHS